jgi:hypothetical protein
MIDEAEIVGVLDQRVRRRDERREFFKAALGAAAVGAGALAFTSQAAAQSANLDTDIQLCAESGIPRSAVLQLRLQRNWFAE